MRKRIWADQIRWLANALTGGIGATALAVAGLAKGAVNIGALPLAAVILLVAVTIWATGSFIVAEMEDAADEGEKRDGNHEKRE